jgi:hypothetical protein
MKGEHKIKWKFTVISAFTVPRNIQMWKNFNGRNTKTVIWETCMFTVLETPILLHFYVSLKVRYLGREITFIEVRTCKNSDRRKVRSYMLFLP